MGFKIFPDYIVYITGSINKLEFGVTPKTIFINTITLLFMSSHDGS